MKVKALFILLAVLSLSGCGVFSPASPTPLPTIVLEGNSPTVTPSYPGGGGGGVTASGNVAPAQQAQLALAMGGNVKAVNVAVGDTVKAGQVLVSLAGSERLTAAVQAAALELLSAQQALKDLNDNAAQARAQAQQDLANAQKALKDAQTNRYQKNLARVTQATIDQAQANLIIAQDRLKKAQETYDKFSNRAADDVMRAQALSALAAAQQVVQQDQWNLDWLIGRPDTLEIAQADAAIVLAQATLDTVQQRYNALQNGPDPDALALAQARIQNAQAQVAASQAALADLELKAPFDGTISLVSIHAGEWAVPGQPVLGLADIAHLRVETTDLSERDVPQVKVGQAVTVHVKALNQDISGKVAQIAPLAETLGGDVVYTATIDLSSPPAALRAGMSVTVQFNQ
jgi:HlyD family secretion protein